MKHWKDYPHLFANGKFFARNKYFHKDGKGNTNLRGTMLGNANFENYILEARPISDLTDDEIYKLFEIAPIGHPDDFSEDLEDEKDKDFVKENCRCLTDGFLYLLSIGVYPFNQDNPEDVVWRYENE